jgi:hypothetical protein
MDDDHSALAIRRSLAGAKLAGAKRETRFLVLQIGNQVYRTNNNWSFVLREWGMQDLENCSIEETSKL